MDNLVFSSSIYYSKNMSAIKVKLSYKDLLLFPDNGKKNELIDGDHYMKAAPSVQHQAIVRNILYLFERYFRNTKEGIIFCSPLDVYLSDYDIVEPDLVIVCQQNSSIIEDKYIKGSPDIVVEILSPSTMEIDQSLKKHLYEKYGIKEYWIVNPFITEIKQYIIKGTAYVLSNSSGESITSSLFPELKINLDDVFYRN
ncbi:MAG: Uma2 family endonuclease [Spirochaetales bacterium]|nr:Uma2 family endonuclease [Spirochaetales bacterium]